MREFTVHFRVVEICEALEPGTCLMLESKICKALEPGTCEILEAGTCEVWELAEVLIRK
jgi:uncharacterized cupin superfamily protein